jgi:hypothetical protein
MGRHHFASDDAVSEFTHCPSDRMEQKFGSERTQAGLLGIDPLPSVVTRHLFHAYPDSRHFPASTSNIFDEGMSADIAEMGCVERATAQVAVPVPIDEQKAADHSFR